MGRRCHLRRIGPLVKKLSTVVVAALFAENCVALVFTHHTDRGANVRMQDTKLNFHEAPDWGGGPHQRAMTSLKGITMHQRATTRLKGISRRNFHEAPYLRGGEDEPEVIFLSGPIMDVVMLPFSALLAYGVCGAAVYALTSLLTSYFEWLELRKGGPRVRTQEIEVVEVDLTALGRIGGLAAAAASASAVAATIATNIHFPPRVAAATLAFNVHLPPPTSDPPATVASAKAAPSPTPSTAWRGYGPAIGNVWAGTPKDRLALLAPLALEN